MRLDLNYFHRIFNMGCFDGVIENNWVMSANSHPPWPGRARLWSYAWAVIEASLKITGPGLLTAPPPSWSLCFPCSLRSNRRHSLTAQDMGCYLNVTETYRPGSANSPPLLVQQYLWHLQVVSPFFGPFWNAGKFHILVRKERKRSYHLSYPS